MSDLLDQVMNLDGVFTLGSGGDFSEVFTFTPFGGTARTVYGNIHRDPPEQISPDGVVRKPKAIIIVANDATHGIAMSEINTNATVNFQLRKGVANQTGQGPFLINLSKDDENHDAGMLRLEI